MYIYFFPLDYSYLFYPHFFSFKVFAATVIGGFGGINIGAVLAFSAIFLPQLPDDVTLSQRSWIGKCSSKDDWMIAIGCVCD